MGDLTAQGTGAHLAANAWWLPWERDVVNLRDVKVGGPLAGVPRLGRVEEERSLRRRRRCLESCHYRLHTAGNGWQLESWAEVLSLPEVLER